MMESSDERWTDWLLRKWKTFGVAPVPDKLTEAEERLETLARAINGRYRSADRAERVEILNWLLTEAHTAVATAEGLLSEALKESSGG